MANIELFMANIELLSPAGSLNNMRYAFAYGADAVYAGLPRYSLRVRNNDFNSDNISLGIMESHAANKKFYFTCNLIPHSTKVKTFIQDIAPIMPLKPDALIMADPGLIMLVKEAYPDAIIHLSVQANTVNYAAAKFWHSMGIKRIILSRELSLDEIEEIRQLCPEIELEVFVHGALCIAYSGRCLLSGYFSHRDPNQGSCTNSCRWSYKMHSANQTITGDIITDKKNTTLTDKEYLLEETGRPNELFPIAEDEHGTYIMNSKDLRAVEHVDRLIKIGINSLKIEGRTKSHYYAARTAQVYRQAIDNSIAGNKFDPKLLADLENLASRGYTDGFYQRHQTDEMQNYIQGHSSGNKQQLVGEIISYDKKTQQATINVKNKFSVGDNIEVMQPSGNYTIEVKNMIDNQGNSMNVAKGSGHIVIIPLPKVTSKYAFIARNFKEQIIIKSKYIDTNININSTAKPMRRPSW